jgi:SpoVK/Ycf46/Vps4 family AAA+-type ATPase
VNRQEFEYLREQSLRNRERDKQRKQSLTGGPSNDTALFSSIDYEGYKYIFDSIMGSPPNQLSLTPLFSPTMNPTNPSTSSTQTTTPATKMPPVRFSSVIMPDEKRQQIMEALEQVKQHKLIFDDWGFKETIEKGRGVIFLFYGPPGTGKTLTAQALAHELKRSLKVIASADIESSQPGQAERNIRTHFKSAKGKKTILLFDECDSLIYSRKNVGPIMAAQINELLSQLERFDGIAIFTTNRLGVLDEAVNRRIALKLAFELPTRDERARIWQRMFPEKAPLASDIDWHKLAVVEISGGYIKNAVLRAARMAAIQDLPDAEKKIHMHHLVKALQLETESMMEFEKTHIEAQGRWFERDALVGEMTEGGFIQKLNARRGMT